MSSKIRHPQPEEEEYINPILRRHQLALPRIYGSVKPKKYDKNHSQPPYRFYFPQIDQICSKKRLPSKPLVKHMSLERSSMNDRSSNLSKPKEAPCIRRYCPCNLFAVDAPFKKKFEELATPRPKRALKLNPMEKRIRYSTVGAQQMEDKDEKEKEKDALMPDDGESTHKIIRMQSQIRKGWTENTPSRLSSRQTLKRIEKIDQIQFEETSQKKSELSTRSKIKIQSEKDNPQETSGKATTRKVKQEASEQDRDYLDKYDTLQPGRREGEIQPLSRINSARNETKGEGTQAVLSQNVFKVDRKEKTMFKQLSESKAELNKSTIRGSNAGSGVEKMGFTVPQEQDYAEFLKSYKPRDKLFKVENIARKPTFKIIRAENGVYFGEASETVPHGKGLLVDKLRIFEGTFENGKQKSGCEINADGVYRGTYKDGLRQGKGQFDWHNGESFQGQWRSGLKEGFGVWKSSKGDIYQGNWKNNAQHGKGIFRHRLSTYEGDFINFLKDGTGTEVFSNGDRYVGDYKGGRPHGHGRYEWSDGGHYEGSFMNGLREGEGTLHQHTDNIYVGSFMGDCKHGFGKEYYKDGQLFEGQFVRGSKVKGVIHDREGNIIRISAQ